MGAVGELSRALGIRAGASVALLGVPPALEAQLAPLPPRAVVEPVGTRPHLTVVAFGRDVGSLRAGARDGVASLHPMGILWLVWPAGAPGLHHGAVRQIALDAGLDVEGVRRLTDGSSALRTRFPLERVAVTRPEGRI